METLFAIVGIVLAAIPVYYFFKEKSSPKLTVEIFKDNTSSSPIGPSNKNVPIDGVIEMRNAIMIFELTWNIKIIIRNNSEKTAFYPKIYFKNAQPYFLRIDKLNELESIISNETKTLNAAYQEFEEVTGNERNDMLVLPETIMRIEILLEYQDGNQKKYFTHFKQVNKENNFMTKKPKAFND
ncbi:hypothetical protein IM792_16340 [Mucilaginibacter sp. JRF]|uniref:hypothetical protein n=1 Tax=Mucilaginibacter sp. JRF TaxID=2780088 RepID=UPI00187EC1B0|nr:hypothetical protein [Mucilaginibacter sp. JRF]MBE9586023.1 hypothetical protein [Mucilaginibacter sp. JRF]